VREIHSGKYSHPRTVDVGERALRVKGNEEANSRAGMEVMNVIHESKKKR